MENYYDVKDTNQILNEGTKRKIYFNLAICYGFTAFAIFGFQFYSGRETIDMILPFSSGIFCISLLLIIVPNFNLGQRVTYLISNGMIIISVPFLIFKFSSQSAIYGWAAPVLLMLVSIALNQLRMMFYIGGITLIVFIFGLLIVIKSR